MRYNMEKKDELEIKELVKNDVLPGIVKEIAPERELLTKAVEGIASFVERYTELKTLLEDFSSSENFDLSKSINNISKSIANVEQVVNEYNENLSAVYGSLANNLKNLVQKYQSLLDSQNKLSTFVSEIDKFMKIIDESKFQDLLEKLSANLDNIEKLKVNLEQNNKSIEILKSSLDQLTATDKEQNSFLSTIVGQTQQTNKLLNDMAKNNNINTAILFSLMDEWYENKKKNKGK